MEPEPTLAQQKIYDDIPLCFCLEFLKYSKKEIDTFLHLHAQKLLGIQLHKANLESSYCILLVFQTRKYEHHQVLKIMVKHSSFSYREPTWTCQPKKKNKVYRIWDKWINHFIKN